MEKCIDSDDVVYSLASFLSPKELVNLALTCKSFGTASGKSRPWSRMEEVARRQVSAAKDDSTFQWRHSDLLTVEGNESWINVYNRLHLLRTSVIFHTLINEIRYVDNDITHIQSKKYQTRSKTRYDVHDHTAICQQAMDFEKNMGKYFVQFRANGQRTMMMVYFGLMRPIHRQRKMKIRSYKALMDVSKSYVDPVFTDSTHSHFFTSSYSVVENESVFGLLLDLGTKQLRLYKDHKLIETINLEPSNWRGQYCWAVNIATKSGDNDRHSVRVENSWQDLCDAGPIPKENWELWRNSYGSESSESKVVSSS